MRSFGIVSIHHFNTGDERLNLPDTYTVYHNGTPLGTATNLSADHPWVHADFRPYDAANAYRNFFDACTDDDADFPEPGDLFPPEYFDDEMWYLEDSTGCRRRIFQPAVHWNDGDIAWRWRD